QRSGSARTPSPQSLDSPGKLSSQLSSLLAQQKPRHFPGDGSMVYRNRPSGFSRKGFSRNRSRYLDPRLGSEPNSRSGSDAAGLVHLASTHLGRAAAGFL